MLSVYWIGVEVQGTEEDNNRGENKGNCGPRWNGGKLGGGAGKGRRVKG